MNKNGEHALVQWLVLGEALGSKTDGEVIDLFMEHVWSEKDIGSAEGALCEEIMNRFAEKVGHEVGSTIPAEKG